MMKDGLYVDGELWDLWRESYPRPSFFDMWDFVLYDIDDECSEFVRSFASWGPRPNLRL